MEAVKKYVANVPDDAYYREQINTLQKKLDELQTKNEIQADYIIDLEKTNLGLIERVSHLRNKLADIIEGR